MRDFIIGTAGHIDHGKTSLIKRLTGIETDRLKEEKNRGITIELGFAFFELPDGKKVGIVDVPGHERFIKNMLAGASGIDLVLLVVAADEGIMPQTREHMDILTLLEIENGMIVLTKSDLVDEEFKEMVKEDIAEAVEDTFLANAPIVEVSSVTGEGIDHLKQEIEKITNVITQKEVQGEPRLPIDRVFSMTGFGTVVTGTLRDGEIASSQSLYLYPSEKEVKIRNIQVHSNKVEKAYPGQRVAINVTGVKKEDINRGDVLAFEGTLRNSMIIDVEFKLLKHSKRTLDHWSRLRLYHGTREILCRLVMFDREELLPGESCYAQLRLEEEISCRYGDKFVIRFYSPMETIGGGTILDSNAIKQKKSNSTIVELLEQKSKGNIDLIVENALEDNSSSYPTMDKLALETGLGLTVVKDIIDRLKQESIAVEFRGGQIVHREYIDSMEEKVTKAISKYHQKYPLKLGYPKEELRSRFFKNAKGKLFDEILSLYLDNKVIDLSTTNVKLHGFEIQLTKKDEQIMNNILLLYKESQFKPPTIKEMLEKMKLKDRDLLNILIGKNELVKLNEDLLIHRDSVQKAKELVKEYFQNNKELTLGDFRDLLNTTRKFGVPLLEYLDFIKFTKRTRDSRTLY